MVLRVRSSTDDNLIARANCVTVRAPTAIDAASVGLTIAFLIRYGWTYSKKVASYAQHLICTDSIYTIASEETRAPGTLSHDIEHSFSSSEAARADHLAKVALSRSRNSMYDAFGTRFEMIHGGSAFLRALEDVWDMGDQILSSLEVRMLDLEQSDMDATDDFFTFLDIFILAYYNGTTSSCVDAREDATKKMGKFYDLRQRSRTSNYCDPCLVQEMIDTAGCVRDAVMAIAQYEGRKNAVVMNKSEINPMWENGIAGQIALLMLARGMAIDEEDDEIIFQDLVKSSPGIPDLAQVLRRLDDVQRLADTFTLAEEEYLAKFTPEVSDDSSNKY